MDANPVSPTRSPEAARLEQDYLDRLRSALPSSAETSELIDNIRDHIQTALAEVPAAAEVSLTKMATVLEELGSPESIAAEFADSAPAVSQTPPTAPEPAPAQNPHSPPAAAPNSVATELSLPETLDRLFVGYLIAIVGLWVPFIGLYICHMIGFAVMLKGIQRGGGHIPQGETVKKLLIAALCVVIAHFPLSTLSLAPPLVAIIILPLSIGWMVLDIVVFWILMSGLAEVSDQRAPEMSTQLRDRRIIYVIVSIVFFILAAAIGGVIAVNSGEPKVGELVGLLLLPIWWVVGWFLILKPIRQLRNRVLAV